MRGFITRLLITALGLAVASNIVSGIAVAGWKSLLVAALVLGVVNAIVRPLLIILTLPITFFTLGLFLLVVNGLSFAFAAAIVPGFHVATLGGAILGALVTSVTGWFANSFIGSSGRFERRAHIEIKGRRLDE
ncbi:MAG TPA: phage holin family protein [Gemmatimonadales bacterium]|nr:phage holin family protein [Gemmatimonadales bacterium]